MFDRFRIRSHFGFILLLSIPLLVLIQTPAMAGTAPPPARPSLVGTYLNLPTISGLPKGGSSGDLMMHPKLDGPLNRIAGEAAKGTPAAVSMARSMGLKTLQDRIWVLILADPDRRKEAVVAIARVRGKDLISTRSRPDRLRCWLPVDALVPLANEPSVLRIHLPSAPFIPPALRMAALAPIIEVGASTSEALAVMNVPAWHAAGHTGQGVKVGIIDAGFQGYTALLGTDLPATVQVNNFVAGEGPSQVDGGGPHGTACAEVIHDIAPDAALYFAKVDEPDDVEDSIDWFSANGVQIVSVSMGWYNLDAGDGTGTLGQQMGRAFTEGMLFFVAGGNDRLLHWGGTFDPLEMVWAGQFNLTVNIWGDTIGYINCWGSDGLFPDTCDQIPSGIEFEIFLRWADWDADPADMIDYDLYLVKWVESPLGSGHYDWVVVAESQAYQSNTGEPTEQIIQYTSTGDPTYYGVFTALWGHNQPTSNFVNLDLFTPFWGTGRLRHYKTPRSLSGGMSESEDSVTVTAVDVNSPYAQETYSSEGPRNGPGGTAGPPGTNKPNIAGYANVSTQTYGPTGFPGTSSATPHVAGAAALMVGAYPEKTLVGVQQFLEWRAKDLGTSGWDTVYGHGRVHLGDTPNPGSEAMEAIMLLLLTGGN